MVVFLQRLDVNQAFLDLSDYGKHLGKRLDHVVGAGFHEGSLGRPDLPFQIVSIEPAQFRLRQADQVARLCDAQRPDACVETLLDVGNSVADFNDVGGGG